VHEIRREKKSNVLFMPQYAEPWKHRILQSTIDAIRNYPEFPQGSRTWDERVYHPDANGVFAAERAVAQRVCAGRCAPDRMVQLMGGARSQAACAWPGASRTSCGWRWARTKAESWKQKLAKPTRFDIRVEQAIVKECGMFAELAMPTAGLTGDSAPLTPLCSAPPRVAYFPDSFHEVNGVAHTSRHFEAFARRRNLPFLCVRAGDRSQALSEDGNVWTLELPRGFLSFALEKDLRFDPAFLRHIPLIGEVLERFSRI
jgi:hypothetical protein